MYCVLFLCVGGRGPAAGAAVGAGCVAMALLGGRAGRVGTWRACQHTLLAPLVVILRQLVLLEHLLHSSHVVGGVKQGHVAANIHSRWV